jgi:hypothetical protein
MNETARVEARAVVLSATGGATRQQKGKFKCCALILPKSTRVKRPGS